MEMDKDKENITDIEKFSREGLVCSSDFLQSIDIEIVPNDKNKRRTFTTFGRRVVLTESIERAGIELNRAWNQGAGTNFQ